MRRDSLLYQWSLTALILLQYCSLVGPTLIVSFYSISSIAFLNSRIRSYRLTHLIHCKVFHERGLFFSNETFFIAHETPFSPQDLILRRIPKRSILFFTQTLIITTHGILYDFFPFRNSLNRNMALFLPAFSIQIAKRSKNKAILRLDIEEKESITMLLTLFYHFPFETTLLDSISPCRMSIDGWPCKGKFKARKQSRTYTESSEHLFCIRVPLPLFAALWLNQNHFSAHFFFREKVFFQGACIQVTREI